MKSLFGSFCAGLSNVKRLNYGNITLVPKVVGADMIQKFRPICLLDAIFKLLTKGTKKICLNCFHDG